MKQLLFLSFILVFTIQHSSFAQIYGEPIYFEDFANGIPGDWVNGSDDGISEWEYRGPETDPDNTVCSRGNCGFDSQPPESLSLANGFVIYDSNWWDAPEGECGEYGTGLAPGQHFAFLESRSYDFSLEENVVLAYQQQWRHWFGTSTFVEISIDQGPWINVQNNTGGLGPSGPNVEWVNINISEQAGGESDVRVRFVYSGSNSTSSTLYWFAIDDVYFYRPNDNDMLIADAAYTDFETNNGNNGLANIAYHAYPQPYLPQFKFSAKGTNVGGQQQSFVQLNIDILNEAEESVHFQAGNPVNVAPNQTVTLNGGPNYDPSELDLGAYTVNYSVSQDNEDENPDNNLDIGDFEITEYQYGRDEGMNNGGYVPAAQYDTTRTELGNIFEIKFDGYSLNSIAVAISDLSTADDLVYGRVYNENRDTILATTQEFAVNSAFLNAEGESKWMILPLDEPLVMEAGRFYNVQVGSTLSDNNIRIGMSGTSPNQTSFIIYPDINFLQFLLITPMVRMQVFPTGSNVGCTDALASNYSLEAELDDGSCLFPGCTNAQADNFDPMANFEDGTCAFEGCTNPEAINYDPLATIDDGSCIIEGCTNPLADNYNPEANQDDGSCILAGCTDPLADNFNPDATQDDGSCIFTGCTDEEAANYDPQANTDDGSCTYDSAQFSVTPLSGCIPFDINVQNITDVVSTATCVWTINGEEIQNGCLEQFDYTVEETGSLVIEYTYTVGEFESTAEITIEALQSPPVPTIEYIPGDTLLLCQGCIGYNVEWYFNDELIVSGESLAGIQPENNGDYYVLVDAGACSSSSDVLPVIVVGIDDLGRWEPRIYPNPSNGLVHIDLQSMTGTFDLRVMDLSGRVIRMISLESSTLLDLSDEPSGIYLLEITSAQGRITKRVMIDR